MKLNVIKSGKVFAENRLFGYTAWPSVCYNGSEFLCVASGMRTAHIDPLGKVVLFKSKDGIDWTPPTVLIDSPLDDRDAGILSLPDGSIIVSTFTNTREMQRSWLKIAPGEQLDTPQKRLFAAYLERVDDEQEKRYLGSMLYKSINDTLTLGEPAKVPVTSPHGPILTSDGRVLYAGTHFDYSDIPGSDTDFGCPRLTEKGIYLCEIDINTLKTTKIDKICPEHVDELYMCEPHLCETASGVLVCDIRAQNKSTFTVYRSESRDSGKTWSTPRPTTGQNGAPPFLLELSDGALMEVVGKRSRPTGIVLTVSREKNGRFETEETLPLVENLCDADIGYPATVRRPDGSFLTVYYAHPSTEEPAGIFFVIYTLDA